MNKHINDKYDSEHIKPLQGFSDARRKLTEGEWTRCERLLFTSRF